MCLLAHLYFSLSADRLQPCVYVHMHVLMPAISRKSQLNPFYTQIFFCRFTFNKQTYCSTCSKPAAGSQSLKHSLLLKRGGILATRLPVQHNSLSCFSHSVNYSHAVYYKHATGILRNSCRQDVTLYADIFSRMLFSLQLCFQVTLLCC